jgi:hypothetical protein
MSEDRAKQATDPTDLERQIMDSNIPKNEREWWAAREIEKLRRENEIMVGMINDMATIVIKARAALGEKE